MEQANLTQHYGSEPGTTLAPAGGGPTAPQDLPIRKLHRMLKGRYPLAIGCTLAGMVLLGALGWVSAKRDYASTGIVQIRAYVPKILYQTEQAGVLPMFDSYLGAQEALIASRRVIDMAMGSEAWRKLGRGNSNQDIAQFMRQLEIRRRGEMILITFRDEDADAAATATKAIIEAYELLYREQDTESQSERLRVLQDRQVSLTNQINSLRERIFAIANEFGSDGLSRLHAFKLEELQKIEAKLRENELAIALYKAQSSQADADVLLETQLQNDPQYRMLVQKRDGFQGDLDYLLSSFGPNHRTVLETRRQLDHVNEQIRTLAQALKQQMTGSPPMEHSQPGVASQGPAGGAPLTTPANGALPLSSDTVLATEPGVEPGAVTGLTTLEAQQLYLQQLYEKNQAEALDLGRKNLQIEALKSEMTVAEQRLEETKLRLEQINVESVVSGRLVIVSKGEQAVAPNSDKRRQMAVMGGMAGGALGFSLVFFMALLNRTIRHTEEAQSTTGWARLLGILPHLPEHLEDEDQARLAAHSVHHIRTMLQISSAGTGHQVIAVSGSSAGAGKTSLTLALGLSYAESGARVLLIDGDLVGGGLTSRLGKIVRERLGRILLQHQRISAEQLQEALAAAKQTGRKIGQVIVERGLLTEDELRQYLTIQEGDSLGLLNALDGRDVNQCVADTGTPGMFVIPRGQATGNDGGQVSLEAVQRLLAQARTTYDTILVDTGPILGSVESAMLCAAADKVVFVVSRGDEKKLVERALRKLESVGGSLAGFVFNRAQEAEFIESFYSTSMNSRSVNSRPAATTDSPASNGNGQGISDPHRKVASALIVQPRNGSR